MNTNLVSLYFEHLAAVAELEDSPIRSSQEQKVQHQQPAYECITPPSDSQESGPPHPAPSLQQQPHLQATQLPPPPHAAVDNNYIGGSPTPAAREYYNLTPVRPYPPQQQQPDQSAFEPIEPSSSSSSTCASHVPTSTPAVPTSSSPTMGGYSGDGGQQPQLKSTHKSSAELWHDVGVIKSTSCLVSHYFLGNGGLENSAEGSGSQKVELESGTIYKLRLAASMLVVEGLGHLLQISKGTDGAQLSWEPPQTPNGRITEYSVYLAVRNYNNESQLAFVRVYVGVEAKCCVPHSNLQSAHIDGSPKPAIIFRIAARNDKGYGPATQVRWLQESRPGAMSSGQPLSASPMTPIGQHPHLPQRRPAAQPSEGLMYGGGAGCSAQGHLLQLVQGQHPSMSPRG
uniref:Fibronectin type-III domain-containing protein n=1 Tax=Ditylenchus dipsaci TaxID=166011 RepID=A0A915D3W8_9BILA